MNPNINIFESLIKQRLDLITIVKLLELQSQFVPENQVLLNQNSQAQLLKNLLNLNSLRNLENLTGLRPNNILQNPLLSLLGSNLTLPPLFSQNTFNINELFHINNNDSRNLNQNQINEPPKTVEKVQQKSELNKIKSNLEISNKLKIKQIPPIIVIDSDQSVQQCQLQKQKNKSAQKINQIISISKMPEKESQKVKTLPKQKPNNKIVSPQSNKLPNKRIPNRKSNQTYTNTKNTRNLLRGKKIFKEKVFPSKRKRQTRLRQMKKEKELKQKKLKKEKIQIKSQSQELDSCNIFKEGNSRIMIGEDFQAAIPQFILNQKYASQQISRKHTSLIQRLIHPSTQYQKMKEQAEKLKIKQNQMNVVTHKLNNLMKQRSKLGILHLQNKFKEQSKPIEVPMRVTRRSQKIKY